MKVLYITHRIPYPPNKGEKIRSYNILRYLARNHEVHLVSPIDDSQDLRYREVVRSVVKSFSYDTIRSGAKKILSSLALLRCKSISVSYFYSRRLQEKVDQLLDQIQFDVIFCSSSQTAEYLFRSRHRNTGLRKSMWMMDFMDIDSYKWVQYAEMKKGFMRWIYGLEGKHLGAHERLIGEKFDRLLVVSESEKKIFLRNNNADNVFALPNGVDLEFFSPKYESKLSKNGPIVVFTGVMDYWPNVEGVQWFVRNVWPKVKKEVPSIKFYIVGSKPAVEVRRLSQEYDGIEVTGFVEDIREYLAAADICVVPLRIARGIQNKVLEAMATGRAVLCTPEALEGIQATAGKDVMVAKEADEFSAALVSMLHNKALREDLGRCARKYVEKNHSWESNLSYLDTILEKPDPLRQDPNVIQVANVY